jgi:twitching motility protein PilT
MELSHLLRALVEKKGSDLHLKVGAPPIFRINGVLVPQEGKPFTNEEIKNLIFGIMSPSQIKKFTKELELDFSYKVEEVGRFRVNLFSQLGTLAAVLRTIPLEIPTIDELNLPPILKDLALRNSGLILSTGPTGSGKSTTLAAMIDYINQNRAFHIITIEDPIEFVFKDKKSIITQRELGIDTWSLSSALKHALRQDPNVIFIGEMRDKETIATALTAVETGHLVLSTLHTNDAKETINRIMDVFPAEQQAFVQRQLAENLLAVLSQRLLPQLKGKTRIPVMEILINSSTIKGLIQEGKFDEIVKVMEESKSYYGMQTFNQALLELCAKGKIKPEDALYVSPHPGDLQLKLDELSESSPKPGQKKKKDDQETEFLDFLSQGYQKPEPPWK